MKHKVYSGIDSLPEGKASSDITKGCLVIEGGAFRAVYAAGVLDVLMQEGINMECTVAVSAGALIGINYLSGQIGRSARTNLRYRHCSKYIGLRAYPKNKGIVGFSFLFDDLEEIEPMDDRFFETPQRFVAVATNCLTGKPAYFENNRYTDIFQAVRASASMPFISRMVSVDGTPYLDGGCCCKIPYQWALDNAYEKILIIRTREMAYRKHTGGKHLLTKMWYRNYPALSESLCTCNEMYNKQCEDIEALHQSGRAYVISPSEHVTLKRFEGDMELLGHFYHLGYDDTVRQLDKIKSYLAE